MSQGDAHFDASLRAFRDLTATAADSAATRARVLAELSRQRQRRALVRRLAPLVVVAAVAGLSSAAIAWTAARRPWRTAPPVVLRSEQLLSHASTVRRPPVVRVIPRLVSPGAPVSDGPVAAAPIAHSEESSALYGRAHRLHFETGAFESALAAWDAYLAAFPNGAMAPEAHYNRAVCLLRLGRYADATKALRPLAEGKDDYRRAEAAAALQWIERWASQ